MQIWKAFIKHQNKKFNQDNRHWLLNFTLKGFDARNLYLEAKSPFHALWFEEHLKSRFDTFIRENSHRPIKVHLELPNTQEEQKPRTFLQRLKEDTILHPRMTFEHYIQSPENHFAIDVAKQAIQAKDPCLIFFSGIRGCGKSHLLQSLTYFAKSLSLNAIYVTVQTFTNHFVTAIRLNQMGTFRNFYRNAECLAIDDCEVFENKNTTQEEFFHLFNHLHLNKIPMLFSSLNHPNHFQNIEPRITSRLQWGVCLKLYPLKPHEIKLMMQKRIEALNVHIDEAVLDHIFKTQHSNTAIQKTFDALFFRMHLNQLKSIDLPQVLELLEDYFQKAPTFDGILHHVAKHFAITKKDILSKSKLKKYARARKISMFLCRKNLHLPYTQLSKLFQKDHSTVITSVKIIEQSKDTEIQKTLDVLEAAL
ncbi:MAG: Chromosomal replication initiator protein DnaA [Chlamydiae bacterium]|nr:Chromosomal replication initiator protein DnaA [Chlamydiota bacterium]